MIFVAALVVLILALGARRRWPWSRRLALLGGLWLAIMAVQWGLPSGHPLRQMIGGTPQVWASLALLGLLGGLYGLLVGRLRNRAKPAAPAPAPAGAFRPAELDRYARHILLREIGGPGQRRLKDARVLVVGAGGLGSPALFYLAAAGVGTIGVIDDDTVEGSNLQRQIIHSDDRIGLPKVFSAEIAMKALNPFITVRPYRRRLEATIGRELIADYDLVLDGTDNFDTRYLVNELCVALGKPLISGAITQWEGQVSLWHPQAGGPCYACVFPTRPAPGMVPTCAEAGVAAPLPGVIGSIMAMEAVKHLTGAGAGLMGRLMIHDALYAETRTIAVQRRADCPVCAAASMARQGAQPTDP